MLPLLIVLVTGESCAGKDYCADIWAAETVNNSNTGISAEVVGISDAIKEEYALATGADLDLLHDDREYKEQRRAALTGFWEEQIKQWRDSPESSYKRAVTDDDVHLLFITGMRDKAPLPNFCWICPETRMIEIRVEASRATRSVRRGRFFRNETREDAWTDLLVDPGTVPHDTATLEYRPSLIFDNDNADDAAIKEFAVQHILPILRIESELWKMINEIRDFPDDGITFHHILEIAQQKGGLELCTSLLQKHFTEDWAKIDRVVACEAGGYLFAAPLAMKIDRPMALIRKGGKLPPPTISVTSSRSHISELVDAPGEEVLEIEDGLIEPDSTIMVIDDVLASGETLYAVLQLLRKCGIRNENINIMVVAELPEHCGRLHLYRKGFGNVVVRSLLVLRGF